MQIITRKEARALDLKKYFTGKPCGTCGKIAERHVRNGNCVACGHFKPDAAAVAPEHFTILNLDKLWR